MTRLEEIVSRIAYKPGYTLKVLPQLPTRWYGNEILEISMMQPNRSNPSQMIPIQISRDIMTDDKISDEYIIQDIQYIIRTLELHEIDEWFRVDGELYNDPHKGGL